MASEARGIQGRPRVLICDDEVLVRWALGEQLERRGFRCSFAEDGEQLLAQVDDHAPAAVLLDLQMPKMGGLKVLRELRKQGNQVPVVVLTATGGIDEAIEATQLGAVGWLEKPWEPDELSSVIPDVVGAPLPSDDDLEGYGSFVGQAPSLQPLYQMLRRLEEVDGPTVLITGETGTGKDVLAREIHRHGSRQGRPFVTIDCTALPENLIESELFGHERGAFTGANRSKPGLFEVGHGGTIFLDEIGELPAGTQAKLLRTLENRTFRRVGGTEPHPLDIGVIAATNRRLAQEVETGRFREDLFYRLDVVSLRIPSLREREEDIPRLVAFLLDQSARRFGTTPPQISTAALQQLQAYSWPGNVRQLRNVLERLLLLAEDRAVEPSDLPPEVRYGGGAHRSEVVIELPPGGLLLEDVERSLIIQAMERTNGNVSASARLLGLSRDTLRYRLKKLDLR